MLCYEYSSLGFFALLGAHIAFPILWKGMFSSQETELTLEKSTEEPLWSISKMTLAYALTHLQVRGREQGNV